jgi:hypothetical protein
MKCTACCKKLEENAAYTAYPVLQEKVEEVCRECKNQLEQLAYARITDPIAEAVCNACNGGSAEQLGEALFDSFQRQHRYLQGEVFTALLNIFRAYAKLNENQYDARNEWVVQICRKITEVI